MAGSNKRKNWKAKRKKILIQRLLIAGVSILFLTAIILLIRSCGSDKDSIDKKETATAPEDTVSTDAGNDAGLMEGSAGETANADGESTSQEGTTAAGDESAEESSEPMMVTAETVPDERSFVLSAVGDCTLGTDKNFNESTSFNAYCEEYGTGYFFENVKDVLSEDDLTIANLECTFTTSTERNDKTYAFKAPPEYAEIVAKGSIEACNLANNHSNDYGTQSYTDTIEYVEALGIPTFGYDRYQIMDVNGIKVGLIGYLELWDEYDTEPKMIEGIETLKENGAEVIIVTMHWGNEKDHYPDDIQQYLGHSAIDHGAHLVLGHHSHRIQGIEVYKGRPICYSLSNFSFGGNRNPSDMDTFIFRQTITVKDGEVLPNKEYETIPCSISSHSDYNDYKPRVLEGESAERVLEKIAERSEPFSHSEEE